MESRARAGVNRCNVLFQNSRGGLKREQDGGTDTFCELKEIKKAVLILQTAWSS